MKLFSLILQQSINAVLAIFDGKQHAIAAENATEIK
jgi:hypothetical protein